MRILMAGDPHGDRTNVSMLLDVAVLTDCTKIMFLGDFGYFEHIPQNPSFVTAISVEAVRVNVEIHFIKGNHDNHEMLNRLYGEHGSVKEIAKMVYYHPNCEVWEWDGVVFGAIGGAVSIDKNKRTPGHTWWHNEEISNVDLRKCEEMGNVDVLLSHDCPLTGNVEDYCDFRADALFMGHRRKLQHVVEVVKPKLLFHGHFHVRYEGTANYTVDEGDVVWFPIIGLFHNYDYRKQSYVFDTEEFLNGK